MKGHVALVQFLLSTKTANLELKYKNEYTPLYAAVQGGNLEVVKILVEQGSALVDNAASGGLTPLHTACTFGKNYLHLII